MNDLSKARATLLEVGEDGIAQRIDNFLLRRLKGVPKSHVYRVLRSGEVRVNSGAREAGLPAACGRPGPGAARAGRLDRGQGRAAPARSAVVYEDARCWWSTSLRASRSTAAAA
jgi:23S rRNA-/tRNA-specific pseudouridylate synthase